jgi:hypothetical protein
MLSLGVGISKNCAKSARFFFEVMGFEVAFCDIFVAFVCHFVLVFAEIVGLVSFGDVFAPKDHFVATGLRGAKEGNFVASAAPALRPAAARKCLRHGCLWPI